MKISQRSTEKELIDLGSEHYTQAEYEDCLLQLDRIGRFLGGDRATFFAFKQLKNPPASILDVGCGSGLFTLKLAKRYPKARVMGIDISTESIKFAKKQQHCDPDKPQNATFNIPASPALRYPPNSFDVITTTLVCHHLSDKDLIHFLKQAYQIAHQSIIINDLHRHPLASLAFSLVTPIFFRNRLVQHDGHLSIKRAFTRKDWIHYLNAAKIPLKYCKITWHWAFRWIVAIDTSKKGQ